MAPHTFLSPLLFMSSRLHVVTLVHLLSQIRLDFSSARVTLCAQPLACACRNTCTTVHVANWLAAIHDGESRSSIYQLLQPPLPPQQFRPSAHGAYQLRIPRYSYAYLKNHSVVFRPLDFRFVHFFYCTPVHFICLSFVCHLRCSSLVERSRALLSYSALFNCSIAYQIRLRVAGGLKFFQEVLI